MKKYILFFGLALCYMCATAKEDITLLDIKKPSKKKQQEIPVNADMEGSLLGFHFSEKVNQVTITVMGPEGVVYRKEVTTPFPESVYVDLTQYRNGEYTIYIEDTEGNLLLGNFVK